MSDGFPAPGPQDRGPVRDWRAPANQQSYPPAGPMPQIPMLTAHKPGIVPLRPLALGDILDGAVKSVRFNPKAMVGLSALVLALFLIPSAALAIVVTHVISTSQGGGGSNAQGFIGVANPVIQFLTTTLATAVLSGLLIHVVSQAVLGRKPDLRQTWQATRARIPSLLILSILSLLFLLLSLAVLIGPGVLLMVQSNVGVGVAVLFLGLLGFIAVSLFASTKISMAAPAIVLEGHGLRAGLQRSFALTRGAVFWRILGITLLAAVIAGFAGFLLGFPFSMISLVVSGVAGPDSELGQVMVTFLSHLSALLTGAITTPFVAAVTGLLYIDRRMRLEALDVVLMREAQTNPPPPL